MEEGLGMGLLLLLSLATQDSAESYYKLKPGTTAVLQQVRLGRKSRIDIKVLREEDGKLLVESSELFEGEKEPHVETVAWWMDEGLLTIGQWRAGKAEPWFRLLKPGAKKGDTWIGSAGALGDSFVAKHEGLTELTLPAGTFKDVYWVRISSSAGGDLAMTRSIDFYLAPGVGLVKTRILENGAETSTTELREFKKP